MQVKGCRMRSSGVFNGWFRYGLILVMVLGLGAQARQNRAFKKGMKAMPDFGGMMKERIKRNSPGIRAIEKRRERERKKVHKKPAFKSRASLLHVAKASSVKKEGVWAVDSATEAYDDGRISQDKLYHIALTYIQAADDGLDDNGYRRAGRLLQVLKRVPAGEGYRSADIDRYLGYCIFKESKSEADYLQAKIMLDEAIKQNDNHQKTYDDMALTCDRLYHLTSENSYLQEARRYNMLAKRVID